MHGLLKSSYNQNREQIELREVTRYRKKISEERARSLLLKNNEDFKDLGADYYNKVNTEKKPIHISKS